MWTSLCEPLNLVLIKTLPLTERVCKLLSNFEEQVCKLYVHGFVATKHPRTADSWLVLGSET
jgi:hypothetical protein